MQIAHNFRVVFFINCNDYMARIHDVQQGLSDIEENSEKESSYLMELRRHIHTIFRHRYDHFEQFWIVVDLIQ